MRDSERMGTYRANVTFTAPNSSPGVNVWHMRTDTDATDTAGKAMAQDALDKLRVFYAAIAGGLISGAVYRCDGITDVNSDEGVSLNWTNVTGTSANQIMPPALAIVVGWKTSIRARRGMGRTFLGPFTYAYLDGDGTILAGGLTAINNAATALVNSSLLDNGWAFGVYGQQNASPNTSSAGRALLPHVLRDFTGYSVKDKWAVLTSRRP